MAAVDDRLGRDDYYAAAMEILAADGVAGLTTTRVCERLDVTRGSLYHHFESGPAFHDALIDHWERVLLPMQQVALHQIEPEARIDLLHRLALAVDHEAEKALRAWGHTNATVGVAMARVDAIRERELVRTFVEVGIPRERATTLARIGYSILLGAQQLDDHVDRHRLEHVLAEYRRWIDDAVRNAKRRTRK